MALQPPGQVIGSAGGSLAAEHQWAANDDVARVGRGGELKTAMLLADVAQRPGGPTVFHDLRLPHSKANADHVVISGRAVTVIDSKVWKPGLYWWWRGRLMRALTVVRHGERVQLDWAVRRLERNGRVRAEFAVPMVVVWSSNPHRAPMLGLLRIPGTRVLAGRGLSHRRLARILGAAPADPAVVSQLMRFARVSPATSHPSAMSVSDGVTPERDDFISDTGLLLPGEM